MSPTSSSSAGPGSAPPSLEVDFVWRQTLRADSASGTRRGLEWGISSRRGGVSAGPFAELNLGGAVGDEPLAVQANRAAVATAFGVGPDHLLLPRQCHGADVAVIERPWPGRVGMDRPGAVPEVDALVTTSTSIAVGVLVADCVPVLLADRVAGVAAAVHSGRQGLVAGVVPAAVARMTGLGADPARIEAVVGPSICGRCYEVPASMADRVARVVPIAATLSWQGTPALDLGAAVVSQLRACGVAPHWVAGCTRETAGLFSYRRDRVTGRFAAVVRLTPA